MQSKKMSFIEAKTNAVVGLLVSWLFTYLCLPFFGLDQGLGEGLLVARGKAGVGEG